MKNTTTNMIKSFSSCSVNYNSPSTGFADFVAFGWLDCKTTFYFVQVRLDRFELARLTLFAANCTAILRPLDDRLNINNNRKLKQN